MVRVGFLQPGMLGRATEELFERHGGRFVLAQLHNSRISRRAHLINYQRAEILRERFIPERLKLALN
jgi:hypothetical protein